MEALWGIVQGTGSRAGGTVLCGPPPHGPPEDAAEKKSSFNGLKDIAVLSGCASPLPGTPRGKEHLDGSRRLPRSVTGMREHAQVREVAHQPEPKGGHREHVCRRRVRPGAGASGHRLHRQVAQRLFHFSEVVVVGGRGVGGGWFSLCFGL